ncbi:MAG TPA: adenylate/guanylate cyclase domain-containing protein [Cyanobacteria bacterium UBA8803]|nr:adenylate/guanylate cyclase domain-containing protein [Cyanobacteria bacterium UBA9273]HBL57770.1 adenylate/guanylate cyclase domain-containing protein [Cyanobacteria bacterium UBA8803]
MPFPDLTGIPAVAIAMRGALVSFTTIAVALPLLGMRHLGGLEPLEIAAFDQLVRLKPAEPNSDPRILVVEIGERDIDKQKRWPISDRVVAQVLSKLQAAKPAVIGLDLYRNLPVEPGQKELAAQLAQPNAIAIQNIDTRTGTAAPPKVPPERIGFNDVAIDWDNVVRRNVLFAETETDVLYSFSLRLALAYLEPRGIALQESASYPGAPQLSKAVFLPLTETSGGYQKVEAAGYQILLNYRSPNHIAKQVSFSDILDGKVDPSWVKDKIVLIGSTAPSLKDIFATPYSPSLRENSKMPGVLLHAQMVSQLLDAATGKRPLFWFWSDSIEILWIVGWIFMGSLVGRITSHPVALITGTATSLLVLSGSCFYLFTTNGWVPLATPALGFVLAAGTIVSYRSYEALQKHKIVFTLLGQNTSPQIAQALWRGRKHLIESGKLPGISLIATMLFADIRDFSTISEQMTPEALLIWLNEILEIVTQEVIRHHGIVNKFTGDGIMAVFGVPTTHLRTVDEDAKAAVDCALAISDRLEQMNRNRQSKGLAVVQMRIGIFTGPVVAGSLGGKDRLEYGVIGDSVNIAARLESYNKDCQPTNCRILIGDTTWKPIEGQFEVEDLGELVLKGKQQKVKVYRVLKSLRGKHPPLNGSRNGLNSKSLPISTPSQNLQGTGNILKE